MDEVLKRRLVGAVVLLMGAFVLSLLLPRTGAPLPEDGVQRVVLDLNAPPEQAAAEPAAEPAPVEAVPAAQHEPVAAVPDDKTLTEDPALAPSPADTAPVVETPVEPVIAVATPAPAAAPKAPPQVQPLPKPEAPKPAAAPAAKPLPPAAALPAGNWFVQVGSFADINNARAALDRLSPERGRIAPAETPGGISYRVQLGPYASKEKAVSQRDRLSPQARVLQD